MLRVEADAIANEALHGSLAILEREMNVILAYLNNVGTQAALCAGFAFALFYEVENPQNAFISIALMVSAVASFSAMIYTVVCSTISASLGPMMAFKGEDSSAMRRAVDSMKGDRRRIVNAFAFGIICIEITCFILIWVKLDVWVNRSEIFNAIVCSILFILGFAYMVTNIRMMQMNYRLPDSVTNAPDAQGGKKKLKGSDYIKRADELQSAPGMQVQTQSRSAQSHSGKL